MLERVKDLVLNELEKTSIFSITYAMDKDERKLLNFLYRNKIINDLDLDSSLEQAVIMEAKNNYNFLTRKNNLIQEYPDHLAYPECLAYAIEKKVFSDRELKKLKFDHKETPESFVHDYSSKDLIPWLRKKLFHPTQVSNSETKGYCKEHGTCFECS
ncbi:Uncharacterised protein [uncultured archaeon]|nr:Uncharacterised protein [uncultured archaeon]